jgi:hypothetical protein
LPSWVSSDSHNADGFILYRGNVQGEQIGINMKQQYGDLARAIVHEHEEEYPTMVEIVAWWGPGGRKGRRRSIEIKGGDFFGITSGAPLSGDHLIAMINNLRRQGPEK